MRHPIVVVKVPLADRKPPPPPSFPHLGELYLYFLENKSRIKESMLDVKDLPPRRHMGLSAPPPPPVDHSSPPPSKPVDEQADRLAAILGRDDPIAQAKPNDKYNYPTAHPSVSDLERRGHIPTQTHIETVQSSLEAKEERAAKQELLHRFAILRRGHQGSPELATIPEFNEFSNYDEMKLSYDNAVRRLALDSSVSSYKNYLIMGFYLIEFGGTKYFKLPFDGFAMEQIGSMNKYERLLVELGEKSYLEPDSKWPVELRLLGVLTMNAGIFLMTKIAMGQLPSQLQGMVNTANNPHGSHTHRRKRRMRGPSVNVDEIPSDKTKTD